MRMPIVPTVALATALMLLGSLARAEAVTPPVIPADAQWNVLDFGAQGDGETDNTAAFQAALDAAGEAGGGEVFVPLGRYRFEGSLQVPRQVALRGVFRYAPAHAGVRDRHEPRPEYGTVLMPVGGRGELEGTPFILLQTNSVLQGVCVYYPEQDPAGPVPTPYPYAVAMRGNNPAIIDVELLNPYQAIDASRNQRALIRNVHGQPLFMGVFVDAIYDIGRIENVHWNPWWSMQEDLFRWQEENGTAFSFGRTDWHYVLNTFCFGYHVGYHFFESDTGVTNGNFLGIGADKCHTAVLVEQSAPYGILITNGEFVSFTGESPVMVRVLETNRGVVRFVNSAFWGPAHRIAEIAGHGTIGFSDCNFHEWGRHDGPQYAFVVDGGHLMIRGSQFHMNQSQVHLRPGVQRAIISDNFMQGRVRITNESEGQVVLRDNLGTRP